MFCRGAIERIVVGRSSAKSNSCTKDAVFSFLLCSSASSAIDHTNLCDRALYQIAAAFQHCRQFV
jgi:hypothetical protein